MIVKAGFSQNYVPMFSHANEWYIHLVLLGSDVDERNYSLDTLINGTTYYPLHQEDPGYFPRVIGYLSEDTTTQKVYFYDRNANSGEIILSSQKLLYDFNINIGDTISIYSGEGSDNLWLESLILHKIQYNNLSEPCFITPTIMPLTRVFVFTELGHPQDTINWIEGTGSLAGILSPGSRGGVCSFSRLNCHYKDGINLFKTGYPQYQDTCSLGAISIESNLQKYFSLYPNPANDILNIMLKQDEYAIQKVEISDIVGNILITTMINRSCDKVSIPIEILPNGIYFCHITTKNGHFTNVFTKA